MNNKSMVTEKMRKIKVFAFIFLSCFSLYSHADQAWASSQFWNYDFPVESGMSKEYYGAYPVLNGEKGKVVQGCVLKTNNTCTSSWDTWGAGYFIPGGMIKLTVNNTITPGGSNNSNVCYFRGIWSIANSNRRESRILSNVYSSMSQTVSNNSWTTNTVVMITDPIIINKSCSDITPQWISESGTQLLIPVSSTPLYANITEYNSYGGMFGPKGEGSIYYIRKSSPGYFQYSALVCSSNNISKSTCIQSNIPNSEDIGAPGSQEPVIPTECEINGNNIIEIGNVSKKDYLGARSQTDMNVQCSRKTTVSLELVDESLNKNGVVIKMSINKNGIKESIPVNASQAASFFIDAEVISIAESTPAGSYEMSNILIVSYN